MQVLPHRSLCMGCQWCLCAALELQDRLLLLTQCFFLATATAGAL